MIFKEMREKKKEKEKEKVIRSLTVALPWIRSTTIKVSLR